MITFNVMDISEDLRKYIEEQRSNGVSDELIKASVIKSGWPEDVANKALKPDMSLSGAAPKAALGIESKQAEPSSETQENIIEDKEKETPTKPKKKRWLAVSIILLVVALLSVGGWFGLQYFSSERVVVSSLKSLLDSGLSKYQLSLDFEAIPPTGKARAVAFSSYELSAIASIDTESNTAGATLEIGDKTNSLGVLEVRRVNDAVYLRIDILDESFLGLEEYNQQWFSISLEGVTGSRGVGGGYQLSADDAQVSDIVAAYKNNPFITVVDELGTKNIGGEDATGYQVSYNKDKLAGWLAEAEKITNQPNPRGVDKIKLSLPEPEEGEILSIWISKKSDLPVGLEYDLAPTADNTGYKARLTISNIGEPIEVVEPSPATPLDDVLGGFISSFDLATESLADSRKWLLSGYR